MFKILMFLHSQQRIHRLQEWWQFLCIYRILCWKLS